MMMIMLLLITLIYALLLFDNSDIINYALPREQRRPAPVPRPGGRGGGSGSGSSSSSICNIVRTIIISRVRAILSAIRYDMTLLFLVLLSQPQQPPERLPVREMGGAPRSCADSGCALNNTTSDNGTTTTNDNNDDNNDMIVT